MKKRLGPLKEEDRNAIREGKATLLGEGKWEKDEADKDEAYQVYQVEDRYIAIIVYDSQNRFLIYEVAKYISKEDVEKYI